MSYEKWSLGYWCLKRYILFADWIINKKTVVTGKKNIPDNTPIVFAANHQNALSDPLAILLNTCLQPVWLARADIFGKSKLINKILKFLKIMPVYRIRDGKESLKNNEKTFAESVKILENNSALALFPEAAHSGRRQMLIHKKAIPRIVFLANEKSSRDLNINIVPAGIYYSHYWKFNRLVIVNFGTPIPVKDYVELHKENPNQAIIELKNRIYKAILPLTINFTSKEHYNEFEKIREIYGNHFLKRKNIKPSYLNHFQSDQVLAQKLNQLEHSSQEETGKLAGEVNSYDKILRQHKLRSWLLEPGRIKTKALIVNIIFLLAGVPLFVYGSIFNVVPFLLIDSVIRKKVRDKTFWSTFFFVTGIIVFPVFYLVVFFALIKFLPGIWFKIAYWVSLPLTGKFAFNWYIILRKFTGQLRLIRIKFLKPDTFNQISEIREKLFRRLDNLISIS